MHIYGWCFLGDNGQDFVLFTVYKKIYKKKEIEID